MKPFGLQSSRQGRVVMRSVMRNLRKKLKPSSVALMVVILAAVYFFFQVFSLRLINRHDAQTARAEIVVKPRAAAASSSGWKRHPKDVRRAAKGGAAAEKLAAGAGDKHGERRATDELAQTKLKYSHKKQKAKKTLQKSSPVRREQAELREKETKLKVWPGSLPLSLSPSLSFSLSLPLHFPLHLPLALHLRLPLPLPLPLSFSLSAIFFQSDCLEVIFRESDCFEAVVSERFGKRILSERLFRSNLFRAIVS